MNVRNLLKNTNGQLRNGWWIAIFFFILSLFVSAFIVLADLFRFQITTWHQLVIIVLVSAICQLIRRRTLLEITGTLDHQWMKDIMAGLVIGTGLMLLPALILTLLGLVEWKLNDPSIVILIPSIINMLGFALAEEFLFRGFIFQRLIDGLGKWPAQVLIGSLFLLTHLDNPGMNGTSMVIASANIFAASILFGITLIKTNRLAMPIALHSMANIVQGQILGFSVSGNQHASLFTPIFKSDIVWLTGGNFGLEASAVGLLTILAISVWCGRNRNA